MDEPKKTKKTYRKLTNAEAHTAVAKMQVLRNLIQSVLVDAGRSATADFVTGEMDGYLWKESEAVDAASN